MAKTRIKNRQRDENARVVARIVGVSESLVHKVRSGNRENDEVIANLIDYKNQKDQLIENLKRKQELYFQAYKMGKSGEDIVKTSI